MGKPTGFKEFARMDPEELAPEERVRHSREFLVQLPTGKLREQGARCMDCGIPFCHSACPVGNFIPDWNDLVYRDDWKRAYDLLSSTNNFPELTGRVCPAPCEQACVLALTEPAVTIKNIESAIAERAFQEGWVVAQKRTVRTGKRVAVAGSGPAGLACAQQLSSAGHDVVVFERANAIGGLLRYGIPDFKLERSVVDRRVALLEQEGVRFQTGVEIGVDISARTVLSKFDALVLALGATRPRDLDVPGRGLNGIHFAMEFLAQQNARVAHRANWKSERWWFGEDRREILATDLDVIVIGGGDSGSDCVGTCHRQGARSVTQFEWKDMPAIERSANECWPFQPMKVKTSSSHEEGGSREWGVHTAEFLGQHGRVTGLRSSAVQWDYSGGVRKMQAIAGSERVWKADMVLIAAGFRGIEPSALSDELGFALTERGTIRTDESFRTSVPKVYAAGDARIGQSLVVWAISEGRELARTVDMDLCGSSTLPTKGMGDLLAA